MINFPLILLLVFNHFFSYQPLQESMNGSSSRKSTAESIDENLEKYSVNKQIPDEIREVTLLALSYYPELMDVRIDFQFQKKIKGSVMQAQPKIGSLLLNNKDNRAYRIKISRYLELLDEMLPIEELPTDVLLGWIGHELGHVKDYLNRSAVNLIGFGVRYVLSDKFVAQAEIAADSHAVAHGMGKAIIATKDFVIDNDRLPEQYRNKIKTLYMSPGEILTLVNVEEEEG